MKTSLLCVLCALVLSPAFAAPVPSRTIAADLDALSAKRWEWAQGETVYLCLTSKFESAARDLTGATCYGVLYAGTNVFLYSTGTVSSATGGVFACTVAAADSNLQTTNDYTFAFFASGATSSAFLGKAEVTVRWAPDASAPRVAAMDYLATANIVTGAVYGGGAAVAQTGHVFTVDPYLGSTTYATNTVIAADGKTNTIIRRGRVIYDWTVSE